MSSFTLDKYLENLFRDGFLEKHYLCIQAISNLIIREYDTIRRTYILTEMLYKQKFAKVKIEKLKPFSFQNKCFRNLRNFWYNETSLKHLTETQSGVMFPTWKIIQFYYLIFTGISC